MRHGYQEQMFIGYCLSVEYLLDAQSIQRFHSLSKATLLIENGIHQRQLLAIQHRDDSFQNPSLVLERVFPALLLGHALEHLAQRRQHRSRRFTQTVENILSLKRKPGRPKQVVVKEFKSISVPKALWVELFNEARRRGISIGELVHNRIRNGQYQIIDEGVDYE